MREAGVLELGQGGGLAEEFCGAVQVLTRLERLSGYNYRYLQRLMAGTETVTETPILEALETALTRLEENPALVVPKTTSTKKERRAA